MLLLDEKGGLDTERNLATFQELLRFCYSNSIETKFYFTPTHVFIVDLWYRLGYKPLWRDLHRDMVRINTETAAEYGKQPFEIWGFGNVETVVDEQIYMAREFEKAWFSDGVHYRSKLGKRLMTSMWGAGEGFGQTLTVDNIDEYLDSVDSVRAGFFKSNRKMVKQLHQKIGLER